MPIRILHAHSTFTLGGKEARAVQIMNDLGPAAEHVILSAVPGALGAREAIDASVRVDFPEDAAPALHGKPSPVRYWRIARYMQRFDLVLTYNWGAMDVVGARRLYAPFLKLPPLIHHEDGFNQDEIVRQNPRRVWFRRLMLAAADRLIVPSLRLERIARTVWRQPASRIRRIANGIRVPTAAEIADPVPIPGLDRGAGGLVIGTVAGLRAIKNLPRLVRLFAAGAPADARLVILGEGPERGAILAEAERLGVADRTILPGFVRDPARSMGAFDIFALSSDSEQFPISLVEAMACGLPALCTDVGDIANMAAASNRPFILPCDAEPALAAALAGLCADADLRAAIGAENLRIARASFDERAMLACYRETYGTAIERAGGQAGIFQIPSQSSLPRMRGSITSEPQES